MKRICFSLLILVVMMGPAKAGSLIIHNKTDRLVKVSSVGGAGRVDGGQAQSITFANEDRVATINIWWMNNARQLCQIVTPWERTIIVTGHKEIKCLSKK